VQPSMTLKLRATHLALAPSSGRRNIISVADAEGNSMGATPRNQASIVAKSRKLLRAPLVKSRTLFGIRQSYCDCTRPARKQLSDAPASVPPSP
jgi:hypothetical protein